MIFKKSISDLFFRNKLSILGSCFHRNPGQITHVKEMQLFFKFKFMKRLHPPYVMTEWLRLTKVASISFLLVACAVGPDFETPCPPQTNSYTESEMPDKTVEAEGPGGQAQCFSSGKEIPANWWYLFHSKPLNELIERGLKNSPNLHAAQAALRQAEENVTIATSALYPFVNLQTYPERQRFNPATFDVNQSPVTFNLFYATVNVSYTLDIFGGIRRQIEASEALLDFQKFEMEATYLTLTSNIVTAAVTEASLRAQIQATEEMIVLQERVLKITEDKFKLGGASHLDVLSQETQLAQTRASLPPLQINLAKIRHALAVLVGDLPSESKLPSFNLSELQLPTELPVSLPSCFVQQRPDIKASEALLHAATAQIGVAVANLLPQVTLSGNYGWLTDTLSTLFNHTSNVWSSLANVAQPLFQGGALIGKYGAAHAAFDQAFAQYRQVVLQAFQNVADVLRALELDAEQLCIQTNAESAASKTFKLTQEQYDAGAVSYLNLIDAERQFHQARIGRIQALAARYADTAALFQALGGGWWNRKPLCTPPEKKKE